ncbi:MAG TPA: indole-3-glycerol phosphate synthase TrpC [Microbacteriaceae bacterium]|nr:indole-3-glycerol phosphate synthase TrpC [Microbacteriaceae bacterium]
MLAGLLAGAIEDATERANRVPLRAIESLATDAAPAHDALAALAAREQVHVIAEIKRASPSRGSLASIPDPAVLAREYADGGASAISVLTESRRFGGSLDDLRAVRDAVEVPLLRKDFIGNEYQVLEARAAGADLVLLIVAALDQPTLARLHDFIRELGMTPLVEAHDADELERAADIGAALVGVNARDLRTFELDRELFGRLADAFPPDAIRVAESAVRTADDVAFYRAAGADAVLVGEALVTGGDPAGAVRSFMEA